MKKSQYQFGNSHQGTAADFRTSHTSFGKALPKQAHFAKTNAFKSGLAGNDLAHLKDQRFFSPPPGDIRKGKLSSLGQTQQFGFMSNRSIVSASRSPRLQKSQDKEGLSLASRSIHNIITTERGKILGPAGAPNSRIVIRPPKAKQEPKQKSQLRMFRGVSFKRGSSIIQESIATMGSQPRDSIINLAFTPLQRQPTIKTSKLILNQRKSSRPVLQPISPSVRSSVQSPVLRSPTALRSPNSKPSALSRKPTFRGPGLSSPNSKSPIAHSPNSKSSRSPKFRNNPNQSSQRTMNSLEIQLTHTRSEEMLDQAQENRMALSNQLNALKSMMLNPSRVFPTVLAKNQAAVGKKNHTLLRKKVKSTVSPLAADPSRQLLALSPTEESLLQMSTARVNNATFRNPTILSPLSSLEALKVHKKGSELTQLRQEENTLANFVHSTLGKSVQQRVDHYSLMSGISSEVGMTMRSQVEGEIRKAQRSSANCFSQIYSNMARRGDRIHQHRQAKLKKIQGLLSNLRNKQGYQEGDEELLPENKFRKQTTLARQAMVSSPKLLNSNLLIREGPSGSNRIEGDAISERGSDDSLNQAGLNRLKVTAINDSLWFRNWEVVQEIKRKKNLDLEKKPMKKKTKSSNHLSLVFTTPHQQTPRVNVDEVDDASDSALGANLGDDLAAIKDPVPSDYSVLTTSHLGDATDWKDEREANQIDFFNRMEMQEHIHQVHQQIQAAQEYLYADQKNSVRSIVHEATWEGGSSQGSSLDKGEIVPILSPQSKHQQNNGASSGLRLYSNRSKKFALEPKVQKEFQLSKEDAREYNRTTSPNQLDFESVNKINIRAQQRQSVESKIRAFCDKVNANRTSQELVRDKRQLIEFGDRELKMHWNARWQMFKLRKGKIIKAYIKAKEKQKACEGLLKLVFAQQILKYIYTVVAQVIEINQFEQVAQLFMKRMKKMMLHNTLGFGGLKKRHLSYVRTSFTSQTLCFRDALTQRAKNIIADFVSNYLASKRIAMRFIDCHSKIMFIQRKFTSRIETKNAIFYILKGHCKKILVRLTQLSISPAVPQYRREDIKEFLHKCIKIHESNFDQIIYDFVQACKLIHKIAFWQWRIMFHQEKTARFEARIFELMDGIFATLRSNPHKLLGLNYQQREYLANDQAFMKQIRVVQQCFELIQTEQEQLNDHLYSIDSFGFFLQQDVIEEIIQKSYKLNSMDDRSKRLREKQAAVAKLKREFQLSQKTLEKFDIHYSEMDRIDEASLVYPKFMMCHSDQSPRKLFLPSKQMIIKLLVIAYLKQSSCLRKAPQQ